MMIDSICFLFSPRFSLRTASHLGRLFVRCGRAIVMVENAAGSRSDSYSRTYDLSTTETL
jgi:hypothetical protein